MTMHSVIDSGACGDGTTDDTAGIQRAFDAAEPGDAVLFPPDQCYRIDPNLGVNMDSGVNVQANGATLQLIPKASTVPVQRMFSTFQGSTLISFVGGTLIGDMGQIPAGKHRIAIRGDDVDGFQVIGTKFQGWKSDAVWIGGNKPSHNVRLERLTVDTFGRNAISVIYADGVEISKCSFIRAVGPADGTPANPGAGVDIESNEPHESVNNLRITDCTMEDVEVGLYCQPGKGQAGRDWSVYGCVVRDARRIGIVYNSAIRGCVNDNEVWVAPAVAGENLPIGISIGGAKETMRAQGFAVTLNRIHGPGRGLVVAGAMAFCAFGNELLEGATQEIVGLGVKGTFAFLENTYT